MGHNHDSEPATVLLGKSIEAFHESVRLNPADTEAAQDLAILEQLAKDCETEHKLLAALRRTLN